MDTEGTKHKSKGSKATSSAAAYGSSLAAVVVAVVARLLLDPLLADHLPFTTLFLAVGFAAWYGGRGPGLLALITGAVAVGFFIMQPRYSFAIFQTEYEVGLVLYVAIGFAFIAMFESLRKAQRQAEEQRRQLEQEVAARRLTEQAAAEQAERLRTTLASIGDGVITTDITGCVTNMNAVAESLTRWTTAEAMGQPLDVVFCIVNETTRKTVDNPVFRALKEGVIVGLANHTVLIAKDGTERPIDDSAAPIRCKEGEVVGCVLVFRDITERHRQEAELRDREQRFHQTVMNVSVPTLLHADDDTVLLVNQVWTDITGYSIEDIPTMGDWTEKAYGDRNTTAKKYIDNLFAADTRLDNGEWIVTTATGEKRVWQFSSMPVGREPSGRRLIVSTAIDITERKRMEEQLRTLAADLSEADRRKDEFLATLAHELRNPLAPIRNGLQLIKLAGNGEAATIEQARSMMERQLTQLVRLVDDLMDVSRITRGKIELRKERVQLTAVVNSAVESSRPLIEMMGHKLMVTLPKQPMIVEADLTRLAQVFSNLLNNAAKYSDRGGHVALAVERQGSDVVVSVKDTGIGIAADQLPRIFDMFTQVDHSLEKSQGGLGIGLTLVKCLVEMHGGRVEARSDGPGNGSEFIVRLPVVVEASIPQESGDEEEKLAQSSLRILIVDDNRDGADSLGMMLRIMGNDIRTAYDGQEGVDVAGEFRPEVVLFDIGMPKLNGYEACRRIREQPWGKGIVLIAVTGWGQDDDRLRSHQAGFDHHMIKPVDPKALMTMLSGIQVAKQ